MSPRQLKMLTKPIRVGMREKLIGDSFAYVLVGLILHPKPLPIWVHFQEDRFTPRFRNDEVKTSEVQAEGFHVCLHSIR